MREFSLQTSHGLNRPKDGVSHRRRVEEISGPGGVHDEGEATVIIGIPKETKVQEYRVGMVPGGVKALVDAGHQVLVERSAGLGSGIADADYVSMGATIVDTAAEAWAAEMVVKVKEPIAPEYGFFREGLVLYTYLHLAAEPELTQALVDRGVTGIAYETIETSDRRLPLLKETIIAFEIIINNIIFS